MRIHKKMHAIFAAFLCFMVLISIADTQEVRYETHFDQECVIAHIENLTANGPRSIYDTEENQLALDYIISQLDAWGFAEGDRTDVPAYVIQEFVTDDNDYQAFYLKNIIVHIPANSPESTGEALMFMGHTDSVPMGPGASDDGVAVATTLEAIRYYRAQMEQGYAISNDLVFCFVNGEEFGLYGSEAFLEEFTGFDNVVERIRFGTNLEFRGTNGTLIMFETAANNYNTIQQFSEINENVFTCSIATMIYDMMPNGTDFSNFKSAYQGLNFATVVYNHTTAFTLAAVLLVMVLANVWLNRKNHLLSSTVKCIGVIMMGLMLTAGVTYVFYYLFQYIAVLAGVLDLNAVGTITFSNVPVVAGIVLMALAITVLTTRLRTKWLKIRCRDMDRAFAYMK